LPHQIFPDDFPADQLLKNFFPAEIKPFHAMMNCFHRGGIATAWSATASVAAISERRQKN
jgi:hypothetical protein